LEKQAIGRAWRMGQKRKVTVHRLVMHNSVESRILHLREAYSSTHNVGSLQNENSTRRGFWSHSNILQLIN